MALIECPDCGKQVSDVAATCIGCGRPLHGASPASHEPRDAPVLIEQSAKPYKAGMLIGIAMLPIGFLLAAASGSLGLTVIVIGVLVFIGSAIARWWHHG